MLNPRVLDQLLEPAIEATAETAHQRGLTAEQHADLATELVMRVLAKVDAGDPALAGRVYAALTKLPAPQS